MGLAEGQLCSRHVVRPSKVVDHSLRAAVKPSSLGDACVADERQDPGQQRQRRPHDSERSADAVLALRVVLLLVLDRHCVISERDLVIFCSH